MVLAPWPSAPRTSVCISITPPPGSCEPAAYVEERLELPRRPPPGSVCCVVGRPGGSALLTEESPMTTETVPRPVTSAAADVAATPLRLALPKGRLQEGVLALLDDAAAE